MPLHAPPHPPNRDVASGVAVRLTTVPLSNDEEHGPGEQAIAPPPVPVVVTFSRYCLMKFAVTD